MSNTTPQIGEVVEFDITGYGGDVEAHWDFGGTGCSPFNQIDTCFPLYTSCLETTYKYASAGPKTASVTIYNPDNGVEIGSATVNLTVQNSGTCGGCVYNIAPLTGDFPIAGGTGTINVTTNAGCGWDADPSHNWITILSGESGEGNGTIQYSVDTNISTPRQGNIQVVNKLHTINQEGTGGGGNGDPATEWLWTVSLDGTVVYSNTEPHFDHAFAVPGTYVVELEAGNCAGSATSSQFLEILDPPSSSTCSDGIVTDDGTPENGYGWGTGYLFVQKFTPPSYPYGFGRVCSAFTQAGGDTQLDFSVFIFDDDGIDGGPGTQLARIPATMNGIPPWLDTIFASVDVSGQVPLVWQGSVYIGVGWDDSVSQGFFVAADESPTTAPQRGYYRDNSPNWIDISQTHTGYRSLLVRASGDAGTDGDWRQSVGGAANIGNGFGNGGNTAATSTTVFGDALFVGTSNTHMGAEVWWTWEGEYWFESAVQGFGNAQNTRISSMAILNGYLYVGTSNTTSGAEIWRSAGGMVWEPVQTGGFGDPGNWDVASMVEFDGFLYVGTHGIGAGELWRSGNGFQWDQVHSSGFGDANNASMASLQVFAGNLYVGTLNESTGGEVWRTPDGVAFFQVNDDGFGDPTNTAVAGLGVAYGALFAATSNPTSGIQVWQSGSGSVWAVSASGGFGQGDGTEVGSVGSNSSELYVGSNSSLTESGCQVWNTQVGTSWNQLNSGGFGDQTNTQATATEIWDDLVFVGTQNDDGLEVWLRSTDTCFADGFESGGTSAWSYSTP